MGALHNAGSVISRLLLAATTVFVLTGCGGSSSSSGASASEITAPPPTSSAPSPSVSPSPTTPTATGTTYVGNPSNYLSLLGNLKAGDTLRLEAGVYDNPSTVPGLPIFGLHGTASQPITITGPDSGPRPVLYGRSTHNTVRFNDASYIVVRNIDIDGRDLGGAGVAAQGVAHHITLSGLVIRGVGSNQQVVGISTNGSPVWNWTIRGNTIIGAGTGMYLGNSDGANPFVAGLIEHNLIRDTIGYNIEIKHQNGRPAIAGMPTGPSSTIVRHNVFHKSANSSTGSLARPNLLVGHFPRTGVGSDDVYEIYGNFFYQNPTEALFQGEGNVVFHHNLLVNDSGPAVVIQPHNDVPRTIRIFSNTVIARDRGISVSGGDSAYQQKVIGNAVFAGTPIAAADQAGNLTDTYANAGQYVNNATAALGSLDLYPRAGKLRGPALDDSSFSAYTAARLDFNGSPVDLAFRGAYAGEGANAGWVPRLELKP